MDEQMIQISVRIPGEIKELIDLEALRLEMSRNALITEVLTNYVAESQEELLEIKKAVVAARKKGRRSMADSHKLADKAAKLDAEEGLGTIKVQKRK
jgi:predicted transcriptional regulator